MIRTHYAKLLKINCKKVAITVVYILKKNK